MELYKHNQEAYEKVMEAFKTQQRAAIVHATGTGKSYIIAAVAEHFERVCVIAPNNFVLDETKKVCKDGTVFVTYASVMKKKGHIGIFDLIVLDEFHRSGADKWGDAIESFLSLNNNAKVLGTSATHIRYLDNMRDMATEVFDGNIVSYLPLSEAIIKGILPKPTYVTALYSIKKDVEHLKHLTSGKSHASKEWRNDMVNKINRISENWENAGGVSHVIAKYIKKDTQRVIVFCSSVRESNNMKNMIGRWFAFAGFDNISIIQIDYSSSQYEKKMELFQQNDGKIKIAISVNMLNEGIHVPNVDAVIMLRSTASRIITEQQMGRCMNAGKKSTPIVLDLVNNIELITQFNEGFGEMIQVGDNNSSVRKSHKHAAVYFDLIDETKDIREVFATFMDEITGAGWYTRKAQMQAFYDEHGRLPKYSEDYLLYAWINRLLRNGEPEQIKWLVDHGAKLVKPRNEYILSMSPEEMVDYLDGIGKKYGNTSPTGKEKTEEERKNIVAIINHFKIHNDIDEDIVERKKAVVKKYNHYKEASFWAEKIIECQRETGELTKPLRKKLSQLKNWGTWTESFDKELCSYGFNPEERSEKERLEWEALADLVEKCGSIKHEDISAKQQKRIGRLFGNSKRSDSLRNTYQDIYQRLIKFRGMAESRSGIEDSIQIFKDYVSETNEFPSKDKTAYTASRMVSKYIVKYGILFYTENKEVCDMFFRIATNKYKRGKAYKILEEIINGDGKRITTQKD